MKGKFDMAFWFILVLSVMCVYQTLMQGTDAYNMVLLCAFCGWSLFVIYCNPRANRIHFGLNYEKLKSFKNIIVAFITLIFNVVIHFLSVGGGSVYIGIINGVALVYGVVFPFFTYK